MYKILSIIAACTFLSACSPPPTSSDRQRAQQEQILSEGTSQVGMPAIKNFRERRLLKDILELRDQEGLVTYSYVWSEMQAKMVFLCDSIGYGIPYATQFTAPEAVQTYNLGASGHGNIDYYGKERLPQADPNGLYSPSSAEGTWIMCKNPNGKEVRPVYVEPRLIVSPFKIGEGSSEATATPTETHRAPAR